MIQLLKRSLLLSLIILCFDQDVFSQGKDSVYGKTLSISGKLIQDINDKTTGINDRLSTQAERYLNRLVREERKLKYKLARKDSAVSKLMFKDAEQQYARLREKIKSASLETNRLSNKYMPHLDTLETAFRFLNDKEGLLTTFPDRGSKLKQAIGSIELLQEKLNDTEEIEAYLKHRRQFLQEQLSKFGMVKDLKKYQKQVYYYHSQVQEYKRMFNDPSKLEAKAIEVLKQTTMFRNFFNNHSQLAAMFSLPGNSTPDRNISFAGLQTRDAVQQILEQRFGSGINMEQLIPKQMSAGQLQLTQLKDKINEWGGNNSDMEMPDFNPNNQKTRSLKNRLEFGTNLQTVKSNRFFPSTSDIGLSLGYKLNDKSTLGVGGSYKVGWGKDIRHISISHQGVGIRSFIDYKIKGSFWLSGGGELNYRSQFDNFEILEDYSAWQRSALIGLSKKYKVSNKLKGNAQLMYDFLWKNQIPRTQPLIFRIGYNLK